MDTKPLDIAGPQTDGTIIERATALRLWSQPHRSPRSNRSTIEADIAIQRIMATAECPPSHPPRVPRAPGAPLPSSAASLVSQQLPQMMRVAPSGRPIARNGRDPLGDGWSEHEGAARRQDPLLFILQAPA